MQLTREHFDKVVQGLATKEELAKTNASLDKTNEVVAETRDTLARVATTVDKTAYVVAGLVTDVRSLKEDMAQVKSVLATHSAILDGIVKNTETWNAEVAALRAAIKRHDEWFSKLAEKFHITFDA